MTESLHHMKSPRKDYKFMIYFKNIVGSPIRNTLPLCGSLFIIWIIYILSLIQPTSSLHGELLCSVELW